MSGLSAVSLLLIGICAHGFALLLAGQYTQRMRTLGAFVGSSLGLGISFGILAPFSSPESLTDIFDLSIENLSNTFAGFPVHGALLAAVALIGMLGAKILTSYFFRKPLSRWVQYIFYALSGGTAAALYASLMLPAACAYAKEINGYNLSLLCPALRHMGEQLPLAYFWTGALLSLSVIDLNLGLIRDRDPKPPSTQRKG
ncbi:MAG: hypothetical protein IPO91_31910 [Chloroflexi bacterium]|nr:hypothetical protein [Chloroflexota bacterium]